MRFAEVWYEEAVLHPIYGTYLQKRVGAKVLLNEGDDEMEAFDRSFEFAEKVKAKLHPEPVDSRTIITTTVNTEAEKEFDEFKKQVDSFKFREDALVFLEGSPYRLSIEAKNYINLKQSKNEKAK